MTSLFCLDACPLDFSFHLECKTFLRIHPLVELFLLKFPGVCWAHSVCKTRTLSTSPAKCYLFFSNIASLLLILTSCSVTLTLSKPDLKHRASKLLPRLIVLVLRRSSAFWEIFTLALTVCIYPWFDLLCCDFYSNCIFKPCS